MPREFLREFNILRKDFWVVLILLLNTFVWFFMTPTILNNILNGLKITSAENFVVWVAYNIASIGSLIVGGILSAKIKRLKFLYLWIIFGAVTLLLPALFGNFTLMQVLIISVLFGVSFGLGVPSCLAYFADCTLVENRGVTSGIILFITNLTAALLLIVTRSFDLTSVLLILAAWRASGLVIFLLKPEEKVIVKTKNNASFVSVFKDRSFSLYFVAWLIFYFVDRLEKPILNKFFGNFDYFVIGPIIGSIFVLIAGLLCDRIGRKRVVLYGFAALGIGYAVIGIVPAELFSWYLFVTIEGVAWGVLMVTFIMILWGDISKPGTGETYYAIGEIPLFLSNVVQLISVPYITLIPTSSAFSVASFFLFLAVLPLLYAPETLPQRKIELIQFKNYLGAAKKAQEKYLQKREQK